MILANRRSAARRRRNAFTLLEVLVVVAILVILASVASIYVFQYLEESKRDKAYLDMKTWETAVKSYIVKNDDMPTDLTQVAQYVDGGLALLKTPWTGATGQTYQVEYMEINGQQTPVIWCQTSDGTKLSSVDKKVLQ
jgi:general secretion pathway protein G